MSIKVENDGYTCWAEIQAPYGTPEHVVEWSWLKIPNATYYVLHSRQPGIFSLGGDLQFFADCVEHRRRHALARYAYQCVDIIWHQYTARPFTIALIEGDAMGGGFEAALACDYIVAEKGVSIGLPEARMGLFPGMGALSFLTRKAGPRVALDLVTGGATRRPEHLYVAGVIDHVAPVGQGRPFVQQLINTDDGALRAIAKARRFVNPIQRSELDNVVNLWVDAVMSLGPIEQARVERTAAVQKRKAR